MWERRSNKDIRICYEATERPPAVGRSSGGSWLTVNDRQPSSVPGCTGGYQISECRINLLG
eukprot:1818645-Rhodomonas_salina.1